MAFAIVLLTNCSRPPGPGHGEKPIISFKSIQGITFIEVARRQKNGLSFNEYGYHLQPEWKLRFVSEDSAALYSPVKKQFLNFPLSLGTDSVFNTARSFLRMKKMSKDSLVLELLEAKNDSMNINGSRVTMLFYSEGFIKNKLKEDTSLLKRVTHKDSLFIKALAAKAHADYKKAFAAQQVVQLISKSPDITITKRVTKPNYLDNNYSTADDYLDPTFNITIKNAYKDFYYSFSVYVDDKGKMYYRIPLVGLDTDFLATYIRMSTGIMNSYLKLYLKVIPGSTLGIPHASTISLHVEGIAKK
ncbi:hypothetical protein FFF34_015705 [Inquilinus sp. KBS0705]|nr:hypothetical protein FFF34_015705 [Inquilinus sp. KBS0705]